MKVFLQKFWQSQCAESRVVLLKKKKRAAVGGGGGALFLLLSFNGHTGLHQ